MTWRDHIKVHPAGDLCPMMSDAELKALGEDIRESGLHEMVKIRESPDGLELLDGRNRLDAMELVGIQFEFSDDRPYEARYFELVRYLNDDEVVPYVISENIRRRHLNLNNEQKRELIGKLLRADPTKSNRQIAKLTKTSHPTVAVERTKLEETGDVVKVSTSIDTKGRQQPVRKPKVPVKPPAPRASPGVAAEETAAARKAQYAGDEGRNPPSAPEPAPEQAEPERKIPPPRNDQMLAADELTSEQQALVGNAGSDADVLATRKCRWHQ